MAYFFKKGVTERVFAVWLCDASEVLLTQKVLLIQKMNINLPVLEGGVG